MNKKEKIFKSFCNNLLLTMEEYKKIGCKNMKFSCVHNGRKIKYINIKD